MNRPSVVVLGITGTLIVVVVAAFLFFRHLVVKSFPDTTGSLNAPGLAAPVDVYRDGFGVPHIIAGSNDDLMYATGYVHAQDRLWQMDLFRRAGEGRLSELFGEKTLPMDRMFRTVGIARIAASLEDGLPPATRRALESYAAGVNAFIASNKGRYPVEFDMLGYDPEPWTVRHSLIVTRLLAWELALGWWTDLTYAGIAERVPDAMLKEIIPGYPDSVRVAVPYGGRRAALGDVSIMIEGTLAWRGMFGGGEAGGGSNAWAVNGNRTDNSKPLLANDPHLSVPQPSRWYLAHLSAGGNDVSGVTVPGVPAVVIGHNRSVAWGLTNAMLDDVDFYVEKDDTTRPGNYIFAGKSVPYSRRTETIRVRGADSVELVVLTTVHGPVVNGVHPVTANDSTWHAPAPLTMRWTGAAVSDEIGAFLELDRARDAAEFEKGLSRIRVPGQAVVYADTSGRIAYWTAGAVPVRPKGYNPMLPAPGWTGAAEWEGTVDFRDLPRLADPPDGIIASANQKITDDAYPHYLSTLWEPPSRIQRIREMLVNASGATADDFKRMQQDVVSPHARELTGLLMRVATSGPRADTSENAALDYLRNWDFRFATGDVATTIFNQFYVFLLRNIYLDEMGPGLFRQFQEFGAVPNRATARLLASDSSLWFDDRSTERRESRDDILRKSLAEALDTLRASMGPVMKEWRWGRVHSVTFRHPFGTREPLGQVFDVGPFEAPGGGTTVCKTEYRTSDPFGVRVGPSMRQVIDLGKPLEGFYVITGGQSGQAFNQHYADQAPLWLNAGYIRITMDREEIVTAPWDRLILEPVQ